MEYFLEKVLVKDKDTLFQLLQYSLFEESANDGNELNEEALFDYPYFENYFTDSNREAYFVKEQNTNKLLGFVIMHTYVQKHSTGHCIAEFMILPKYRRKNLGQNVALDCFKMHHGNLEVSPSIGSKVAYAFWNEVISKYTKQQYHIEDGIFLFQS